MLQMVLKPNVMYNLQGGEEILFADLKAKYTKVRTSYQMLRAK